MAGSYFVYILASRRNGTLYVGVTNDLGRRISEHREGRVSGFTATHRVKRLVWYDVFATVDEAIAHEKRVKHWRREWKLALIEKHNPDWDDLYATLS